jgi:hypothetical protein
MIDQDAPSRFSRIEPPVFRIGRSGWSVSKDVPSAMMNITEGSATQNFHDLATNRGKFPIVDREQDAFLFRRQFAELIELLP